MSQAGVPHFTTPGAGEGSCSVTFFGTFLRLKLVASCRIVSLIQQQASTSYGKLISNLSRSSMWFDMLASSFDVISRDVCKLLRAGMHHTFFRKDLKTGGPLNSIVGPTRWRSRHESHRFNPCPVASACMWRYLEKPEESVEPADADVFAAGLLWCQMASSRVLSMYRPPPAVATKMCCFWYSPKPLCCCEWLLARISGECQMAFEK